MSWTPNSTTLRSTATARSWSGDGPPTLSPVSVMAPKPMRLTRRSPPIRMLSGAESSGMAQPLESWWAGAPRHQRGGVAHLGGVFESGGAQPRSGMSYDAGSPPSERLEHHTPKSGLASPMSILRRGGHGNYRGGRATLLSTLHS